MSMNIFIKCPVEPTHKHTHAFSGLLWRTEKARKCSAAQGPHSEVVPRAFWRLVSKSCDECKGSFARGCEAKRWSHWTCSSLGTILQPMGINSVPDVKCFCNNKNVLCAQSMVWHFVCHPVFIKNSVFLSLLPMEHVGRSEQTSSVFCSYCGVQFSHPGHSHTCDMPRHRTIPLRSSA